VDSQLVIVHDATVDRMTDGKGQVIVLPDIQGAGEGPAKWETAIQKGFTGLQTGHPGDMITWLKKRRIR
jgi:glycerophosphoryl diester phosphodiesterase